MYCVQWKMTILFFKFIYLKLLFLYLIFKNYSIFYIDIYNILFLNIFPTKHYNNILCLCTVN